MKRLLLISIVCLTALGGYAQGGAWRVGAKAGANFLMFDNLGSGFYTVSDFNTAYSFGATAQYKWGGDKVNYSLQPELIYSQSKTDIYPVVGSPFGEVTLKNIELPVNFQLGLQLSPIFRPFIQGGVNFSYLLGSEFSDNEWSVNDEVLGGFNKLGAGVSAGVGFDLWHFQLQGRYRTSLTRLNKDQMLFERFILSGYEISLTIFINK